MRERPRDMRRSRERGRSREIKMYDYNLEFSGIERCSGWEKETKSDR